MKVFITGAAGFIGSRLTEILLDGGHTVFGYDLLDQEDPPGWQEARLETAHKNKRYTFFKNDVTNGRALESALVQSKPDAVVHLAKKSDLNWTESNPRDCLHLHVDGTTTVVEACDRLNIPQLIIGSSAHVYGGSNKLPHTEEDPADRPLSVYGASMRSAELAVHAIALRSPVSITVLRFFSVYGPRQSPNRLLPALAAAAERRAAMPIFGDGTASRDMIYIDDLVVGILRVLDRPVPYRVLNIGSGETTTVAQVAENISWLADVALQRESLPRRPGEMPHTYADIQAAQESIGFNISTQLEAGLRHFYDWHTKRAEIFRQS
jgi:UDP-glucuronate 4-epimerase